MEKPVTVHTEGEETARVMTSPSIREAKKKPLLKNIPFFFILLFLALFILLAVYLFKGDSESEDRTPEGKQSVATDQTHTPNMELKSWNKSYYLKEGGSKQVDIPYGYHLHTFCNDLYGFKPEGEGKETIGNKGQITYSKKCLSTISYVDISFYQKETKVTCLFVENKHLCKVDGCNF